MQQTAYLLMLKIKWQLVNPCSYGRCD